MAESVIKRFMSTNRKRSKTALISRYRITIFVPTENVSKIHAQRPCIVSGVLFVRIRAGILAFLPPARREQKRTAVLDTEQPRPLYGFKMASAKVCSLLRLGAIAGSRVLLRSMCSG